MSDTPLVDDLLRKESVAAEEKNLPNKDLHLLVRMTKLAKTLEIKLANMKALCNRMTDDVDGLTDEDIASITERHAGDSELLQVYVKFLIGLYHKEKSNAAAWRLQYEREVLKHG